jgi:hypothetical protein
LATSSLAGWLVQHRAARIALMAVLFPLPALSVVSVAMVVLVTQTQSWRHAAVDCGAALLVLTAMTLAAGAEWFGIGLGAALAWVLGMVLGALRRSGSLNLAVQLATLMGMAGVVAFAAIAGGAQAFWEQVIREFADRADAAGMDLGPVDALLGVAGLMSGVVAASVVVSSVAALMLGSWWASQHGAGNLGREFQALRMGFVMGVLTALSVGASLTGWPGADDLWLVLGAGYAMQGLAVAHWHAARRRWPRWWPIAVYAPMVLIPVLAAVELMALAVVGLVDNAYSLRPATTDVV